MVKLILFVCFYCIVPIQFFVLRNESKRKKNIVLGVTLPYEAREMEEVEEICARFRRGQTAALAVLTVTALPALLLPGFGACMTWLLCWLIAAMILPNALFARANRRLMALKKERGWGVSSGRYERVVDLKDAAGQGTPSRSGWPFLLPLAVSAVPLVVTLASDRGRADFWGMMLGCGCVTLCVALVWAICAVAERKRADVVDADSDRNAALSRIRRQNLRKGLLWTAWLTALLNLALWKWIDSERALLLATLVYVAVLLIVVMVLEFRVRDLQARLTARCGKGEIVDEDRWWLLGMFYYNPDDRNLMVNSRTGMNTTINLGRPAGKVLMGATVLLILLLPFLGVWIMSEERTPVDITVTAQTVEASHTGKGYVLDRDNIVSVELLEELPPCRRIVGTGMENLLKGHFSFGEDGRDGEFCLDPQVPPFLLIETEDGGCYLFGDRDSGDTLAAYRALTGAEN